MSKANAPNYFVYVRYTDGNKELYEFKSKSRMNGWLGTLGPPGSVVSILIIAGFILEERGLRERQKENLSLKILKNIN